MTPNEFVREHAASVIDDMNATVGLNGLMTATADLTEMLLEGEMINNPLERQALNSVVTQVRSLDVQAYLRDNEVTEQEAILRAETLNAEAAKLLQTGRLTYRKLVEINPEALLPQ